MTMAKEATPVLSGAIPSLELFMSKWEALTETHPNLQPFIEAGLVKAREYYSKMDLTRAYVIALGECPFPLYCVLLTNFNLSVLNPMIKMTWINKQWESKYIEMAEHMIKDEVVITFS
jgi:hypothetical protein